MAGFGGSWQVTELTVARQDKFLAGPQAGNGALSQWPQVAAWGDGMEVPGHGLPHLAWLFGGGEGRGFRMVIGI